MLVTFLILIIKNNLREEGIIWATGLRRAGFPHSRAVNAADHTARKRPNTALNSPPPSYSVQYPVSQSGAVHI